MPIQGCHGLWIVGWLEYSALLTVTLKVRGNGQAEKRWESWRQSRMIWQLTWPQGSRTIALIVILLEGPYPKNQKNSDVYLKIVAKGLPGRSTWTDMHSSMSHHNINPIIRDVARKSRGRTCYIGTTAPDPLMMPIIHPQQRQHTFTSRTIVLILGLDAPPMCPK